MTLQERIDNYVLETKFPRSLFVGEDGRIVGTWVMGNNYTVKSEYYGGYPHGYLKRIKAMFPDKKLVLHLCSGMVDLSIMAGETVDINPDRNPTYCCNAETCEGVPLSKYDLILIDTPYSEEDCEHYGTPMLSRNKLLKTVSTGISEGCHVIFLDQVLPMYKKIELETQGYIGMVKSTNHRFRVITIFEKLLTK
jgi:hypothetical protein